MVTLAERISDSVLRRLPGYPCTLAAQDATAVKSVHGDCFTAPYPQGSTGIPAGKINYPDAAAQPRPPVSAKFREAGPTRGFGLSLNALNINGANTYQFVESNPVNAVDPWGLAAQLYIYVVDRSGGQNTGLTGGHIDMVIPGQGVVGYYGVIPPGANWNQAHGLGIPGYWNHSYKQFHGPLGRPMYINPPARKGCPLPKNLVFSALLQKYLLRLNNCRRC
jgi:hypothetical protein